MDISRAYIVGLLPAYRLGLAFRTRVGVLITTFRGPTATNSAPRHLKRSYSPVQYPQCFIPTKEGDGAEAIGAAHGHVYP